MISISPLPSRLGRGLVDIADEGIFSVVLSRHWPSAPLDSVFPTELAKSLPAVTLFAESIAMVHNS